jgi:hypothetical protein
MRRPIPQFDGYTIDRHGYVRDAAGVALPRRAVAAPHQVTHLAVDIDDQTQVLVWKLMSVIWFDVRLMLPRDGNFLHLHEQNLFGLRGLSSDRVTEPRDIHGIWHAYQHRKLACSQIPENLGLLTLTPADVRSVVCDILIDGVRE